MRPTDDAFRIALREVLGRSGLSARRLSLAMGRDPGYVAALLDPSRPSRARPTPEDLVAASDATGIPLLELLERLWGIPADRLAGGPGGPGVAGRLGADLARLTSIERAQVADFAAFLAARHRQRD